MQNSGLAVEDFNVSESKVSVQLNSSARVKFVSDRGVLLDVVGKSVSCDLPQVDGKADLVYVRVEVLEDSGERLFLQPVLFRES
jgi:hypothetical protein